MNFEEFSPTPEAIAMGMMVDTKPGQEPQFTSAGLFAIAAAIAYGKEDCESKEHARLAVDRVWRVAKSSGYPEDIAAAAIWAFREGYTPTDGTPEGTALGSVCRNIALIVGPGRMAHLIEGRKSH